MRPSVDLTLFGALWRQYLEYFKVVHTLDTTLDILLPGLPVDVSIKMSVDDHSVSSSLSSPASPWDVILVPQVERITFKLYPGAASQVVIEKTVHSLKKN